jgi:hypothetical protein
MKPILIGSRALNYWFPSFEITPDTDWDIISDKPIEGAEFHPSNFLNNSEVEMFTDENHVVEFNGQEVLVCDVLGLAIIKRSHLHREIGWDKSITHYHKWLARFMIDANCSDSFEEMRTSWKAKQDKFLAERIRLTNEAFPQPHPKLNQSVEDFFDDYVVKKYNHDRLHEIVAYNPNQPLYKRLQDDPSSAWCKVDKWNDLSYDDKLKCIAEETYVIAIERFLVPKDWKYPAKLAYMKALKKVCTTLCSGWFRDCAIDNYPKILDLFDKNKIISVKLQLEKETS